MNIPSNLKYSKDDEWVRVEGEFAYIGITDYAQSQLGDIVFVDIQTEGETINADEVFGAVEAVKTVADLVMPISCEIVEFNAELESMPDLVNKDPYGKGWMIKVKMSDNSGIEKLLSSEEYRAKIA